MTQSSPAPPIAGNHSCQPLVETDKDKTTINDLLQTSKYVAQRVINFCLSGPVILPPSPTESRRSLTQTCQLWRDIILTTPAYWKEIIFAPGPFQNLYKLVGLARQTLQRSGMEPLDLDFVGYPLEWLETMPAGSTLRVEELIYGRARLSIMRSVILPNRDRISSVRFLICNREDFDELKNIQGHQFPQLKALDIAVPPSLVGEFVGSLNSRYRDNQVIRKGLDTFQNMHQFALRLLDSASFHPYNMYHLQWNKLTDINFGTFYVPPDIFTGILQRTSPSLRRATFSILMRPPAHVQPVLGPVEIPSLLDLSLTVRNTSQDFTMPFFDALHLPSLRCLQIHVIDECAATCDILTFMGMILPMRMLEILKIAHTPLQPYTGPPFIPSTARTPTTNTLEKLIEGLQNLRVLSLPCGVRVRLPVINRLAHGELLPDLTQLGLSAAGDWKYIVAMVRA